MRIRAEVDIINRDLACQGIKLKNKKTKSILAVGRKVLTDKSSEICMVITNNSNKSGVQYHIRHNVETIFTRMVSEGKCTIRLKQPRHDLCLKCEDIIQLKSFLMVVKKVMDGKDSEGLTLSALQPITSKQLKGPETKLTILKRSDYPTKGFPPSLEQLEVSGVRLAKVDSRMLKLRNLSKLCLADNEISKLPDNWGLVQGLSDLNLSGNQLETIPRQFCVGTMAKSLKSLNLSGNKIIFLPNFFCNLHQLISLDVSKNNIKCLPPSLGKLTNLKHFKVNDNNLTILPGSFSRLR